MSDEAIVARLARIETEIANMREENVALRTTLHSMISRSLAEHSAAISRLAAAHDTRLGIWWSVIWISGALVLVVGAIAWLLEHQIQVVIKS